MVERSGIGCVLRLEGEVNIACAAEIRSGLLQCLEAGLPIQVDMDQVTGIDVTTLQLLAAAAREAGSGFSVRSSATVLETARQAGFAILPGGQI